MKIYNIKGNTYYFETKFAYMPFYMLSSNEIIMLDSGYYDADEKLIRNFLEEYGFTVRAIICTHAHVDHIGNNSWIKEKYNAEIIMPEYESITCSSMYNIKAYNMPPLPERVAESFGTMVCKTDRVISDKQDYIEVLGHRFEIVQLPGHTFYHIGIITPDNVFYVGDSILSSDVIDYTKIAYVADIKTDVETKEKLRTIKCDKYILAHKGLYDDISEVIDENINYLENQMKMIIEIVKKPVTMGEIYKIVFKKLEISKNVSSYILAEMMLKSYVYHLIDNGVIKLEIVEGEVCCCLNKHNAIG